MNSKRLLPFFIFLGFIAFSFMNCGDSYEQQEDTPIKDTTEVEVTVEGLAPGMTPFDFPTVDIQASAGDYVLTPGFKMWQNNLEEEDPTKETYIFYTAEMSETGEVESELKFTFDGKQKMPNSIIIPIPAGQSAKKGDIVLTWWQSGSGMQRAIITDDSNPDEPKGRYLGLYGNPSEDSDSGKSIGETDYQFKPNSFVKIEDEWQVGNKIAVVDESWGYVIAQIVRVANNKVLTIGFAGKMNVYKKTDCVPMPIVPNVNAGDMVQVVGVSSFVEAEVIKVDKANGVVFVKTNTDDNKVVVYGEITTNLNLN